MNDEELNQELRILANKIFSPANSWAERDAISRILSIFRNVTPSKYRTIYFAIYNQDNSIKDYEPILPLEERLRNLGYRMEQDGLYTNADICFKALDELKKKNKVV